MRRAQGENAQDRTGGEGPMAELSARSIARPTLEVVRRRPDGVRVLAAFPHAIDLSTGDGEVVAVVTAEVGNGPLNVVVETGPDGLPEVKAGTAGRMADDRLSAGPLRVGLGQARIWEPRPEWGELRAALPGIRAGLADMRALALRAAPEGSLLAMLEKPDRSRKTCQVEAARRAARALQAGWEGDTEALRVGTAGLAGLGAGLTPAGDDFLAGVMVWAWLAHESPGEFCEGVAAAAAPRTTTLAAALLRAAARGECNAAWHTLLRALADGGGPALAPAVWAVLAHGATSGADMLAGMLWLAR